MAVLELKDFTGGLNFTVPPENLKPNELWMAKNVEYDPRTGVLRRRPALRAVFDAGVQIDSLYYSKLLNRFLFTSGQTLYEWDGISTAPATVGTLSGAKRPKYAVFGNKLLIASGGNLQTYDGVNFTTVTNSPLCDGVLVRSGRVVLWREGSDRLDFSGIGDETNWNFAGTDGDAQYVEIGYKDGGDIVTVIPLSKDLIVFKNNGRVYRLVGNYPSWAVYEVSRNALAVNRDCAEQVLNDIVFLDIAGLRSLATVLEYGEVKQFELGRKVNPIIVPEISPEIARMWHVYKKNQIWVRTANTQAVWVYHYPFKAWTYFSFFHDINDVAIKENDVYVASGTKIFILDHQENKDDGQVVVQGVVATKRFVSRKRAFTLTKYGCSTTAYTQGEITLQVGKAISNFQVQPLDDIAYSDTDIAYLDTDPVMAPTFQKRLVYQSARMPSFEFKVFINLGSIGVNSVFADVKEV